MLWLEESLNLAEPAFIVASTLPFQEDEAESNPGAPGVRPLKPTVRARSREEGKTEKEVTEHLGSWRLAASPSRILCDRSSSF